MLALAAYCLCEAELQHQANLDRADRGEAMAYRGEESESVRVLHGILMGRGILPAALAAGEEKRVHHFVDDESGIICEGCGLGYSEALAAGESGK